MSSGSKSTDCTMTYHKASFFYLLMRRNVDVTETIGVSEDVAEIMWDLA